MTDPGHAARVWTDRSFLRDVQYKTDVNLAARQSIYAYQQPPIDLPREILGLAGLSGHEVVADIGCGNGRYLAELARRGHAGPMVGADLSPGMLLAAGGRTPEAGLLVADATALPFPDATADLTLAMHMLYHVPEPDRAVRELRRITRPGGRVIVALNGEDHLRELRAVVAAALASLGREPTPLRPRADQPGSGRGAAARRVRVGDQARFRGPAPGTEPGTDRRLRAEHARILPPARLRTAGRGRERTAAGRSGWSLPYHHPQRLPRLRLTPHLRPGLVAPG